jgi:hypothetical protein
MFAANNIKADSNKNPAEVILRDFLLTANRQPLA